MTASRAAWLLVAACVATHVTVAVVEQESWDAWGRYSHAPSERPGEQAAALRRVWNRGPEFTTFIADEVVEVDDGEDLEYGGVLEEGGPRRRLLHGCRSGRMPPCRTLPRCPRCRAPMSKRQGHCRKQRRRFHCMARRPPSTAPPRGSVLESETCPNLFTLSRFTGSSPGEDSMGGLYGDDRDYTETQFAPDGVELVPDPIGEVRAFRAVSTAEDLQEALRRGTNHILITAHLDATEVTPERDLEMREALNSAVGRVQNTTLSIAGRCDELPPESFNLTEPVPPRACAILVKEDFLDAPLGTTCLLLDSLYIAVDTTIPRRRIPESSILVLHVDGLMWITNCVFQGGSGNSRAIDTNSRNGGTPELYIRDTTFTTFKRELGPGIRATSGTRVWLVNVTFRDIVQPRLPASNDLAEVPVASAVAASRDVFLVLVNVTIERNEVFGEPAGVRAIAIDPNGTAVFALPRIEVWQWPQGMGVLSSPDTAQATFLVDNIAQPQIDRIIKVQQEIVEEGLLQTSQEDYDM